MIKQPTIANLKQQILDLEDEVLDQDMTITALEDFIAKILETLKRKDIHLSLKDLLTNPGQN